MKRIQGVMVWSCLLFPLVVTAVTPQDAQDLAKTTADKVIARVKVEKAALRANPLRLNALVDELVIPHFDFERMSQWVLGKHWPGASVAQRSKFVVEFRQLLVRTYAKSLLEYSDWEIHYLPVLAGGDGKSVTVKTEVQRPGGDAIPMSYRMHTKDDGWKVYDVTVDGVSIVSTYRSSFSSEIRKGGLDALIQRLVEKNTKSTAKKK